MQRRHPDVPIEKHVVDAVNISNRNNSGEGK